MYSNAGVFTSLIDCLTMNNFAKNCKMSLEELYSELYSFEIGNILERFKSSYKK